MISSMGPYIMYVLKTASKGKIFNNLEKFPIYKTSKTLNFINEQNTHDSNLLFDLIINRNKVKFRIQ